MWRAAENKESYAISEKLRKMLKVGGSCGKLKKLQKVAENGKSCGTATTATKLCSWLGVFRLKKYR